MISYKPPSSKKTIPNILQLSLKISRPYRNPSTQIATFWPKTPIETRISKSLYGHARDKGILYFSYSSDYIPWCLYKKLFFLSPDQLLHHISRWFIIQNLAVDRSEKLTKVVIYCFNQHIIPSSEAYNQFVIY